MKNKTKEISYVRLDDDDKYYYCSDIDVATTLVSKKYNLFTIDKITEIKVVFIFERTQDIEKVVEAFWGNKIEVYPLEFATNRKNLKNRIYGMKKCCF